MNIDVYLLQRYVSLQIVLPGQTKEGSITVLLTSCLTGLDYTVLQIKTKIVSCHTADSKRVKQEVNGTVILPPLVFPGFTIDVCGFTFDTVLTYAKFLVQIKTPLDKAWLWRKNTSQRGKLRTVENRVYKLNLCSAQTLQLPKLRDRYLSDI